MRNRNLLYKKLESLEHILINLRRIVNTQEPIEVYKVNIIKAEKMVEDIRSMIEREPFSSGERNRL